MAKKDFKKNAAELFFSEAETDLEAPQQIPNTGAQIPEGYRLVKESKSERLQLLFTPSLKKAVKKAAYSQGMSMNDLINKVLKEYIERQG